MFITFGNRQGSSAGSAFLFFGTLCTAFGFAILVAPNLLAYFVASLLIIMGISLLGTGWKLRRPF
ncbi:DUF3096 domain-containing protein [Candidatus Peregrinibacteria bacterium]|nr:DUF3096 domain-containing protein [Candidatus Peregrinibacteria bacterium]MBI2523681.1 DUF3096 domain-containing protein [Candidatus Peregrinibacteria bacterium]